MLIAKRIPVFLSWKNSFLPGTTDWRLRLIFQISTCVLQISGIKVEFAFCLEAVLFSPCCTSCSHLQSGRCSVLHSDCSPKFLYKTTNQMPSVFTLIGKGRGQQVSFPFFFISIFFPLWVKSIH